MEENWLIKGNPDLFKAWVEGHFAMHHYDYEWGQPISWLIDNCKHQYKIDINESEVKQLSDQGLIEIVIAKDGTRTFPLFTPDRIDFIKKLQKQFDYSLDRIKIPIISYENFLIKEIYTAAEFAYQNDLDIFSWYLKRMEFDTQQTTYHLNYLNRHKDEKSPEEINKWKEKINNNKKVVAKLSEIGWEKLKDSVKIKIQEWVFQHQFADEFIRTNGVAGYHNQILQGYSPHVEFSSFAIDKQNLDFSKINWTVTFDNIMEYWKFFRTPYFMIEIIDNEISIKIFDSNKVNAEMMRRIEKIYALIRSLMGSKREKWGEKSGRKLRIHERNEYLKNLYSKLRQEKKNIAAWRLYEYLENETKKMGLPISTERIKRVIYTKNKTKTPANNLT